MTKPIEARRILVAEDEGLIAMLLEDMLGGLGHAVVGPFASLDDAIAAARNQSFDVALLDVNLDGRAVYPAAEILQKRGIPFAFVTGYDSRGLVAPWNDAYPILEKPFRRDDLERLLETLFVEPASG